MTSILAVVARVLLIFSMIATAQNFPGYSCINLTRMASQKFGQYSTKDCDVGYCCKMVERDLASCVKCGNERGFNYSSSVANNNGIGGGATTVVSQATTVIDGTTTVVDGSTTVIGGVTSVITEATLATSAPTGNSALNGANTSTEGTVASTPEPTSGAASPLTPFAVINMSVSVVLLVLYSLIF
ncbi:hypothetical protein AX774_g3576 [Zancudomyces culisetae]|uniref:Uncharacterized protein n=1 Tax=Zancudomyces culisetae TaxID=1213189 RepID=A0A1R1PPQ3_ZANCU|nr:hypothetical protein AX774_g3576 [Zancudomyces culisetae]|eukprot:OMH82930.1 hypothetical protein AX774_g3576 [Zancudomyces culisetae]